MRQIAAGRTGREDPRELVHRELPDGIFLVDIDRQPGGHPRRRKRSVRDLDGERLTAHDVSVRGLFEPVGLASERADQSDPVRKGRYVDGVALAVVVDSELRAGMSSREERVEALEHDADAAVARDDVDRALGKDIPCTPRRHCRPGFVRR